MATYIFMDVDGVVIEGYHHNPAHRVRWDAHIERDLGISPGALQTHFFDRHCADVVVGKRPLTHALKDAAYDLKFSGDVQQIVDYWFRTNSALDGELLALLSQIKAGTDTRLYLATNQEQTRADYLWNDLKLNHLFVDIYFSARLGVAKPDPLFYTMINDELGLDPTRDEILYFDDHPLNVEVARKSAGWLAFRYDTLKDFAENPYVTRLLREPSESNS